MKYKVLVNSSLPECSVALTADTVIDDEIDKRLTVEAVKRALKAGLIEELGKPKKKENTDERS